MNRLDKTCFTHDAAYADSKGLAKSMPGLKIIFRQEI